MDGKTLRWIFLAALIVFEVGCASETKTSNDDYTPALEPVPSKDDSHGWGANIQSAGR